MKILVESNKKNGTLLYMKQLLLSLILGSSLLIASATSAKDVNKDSQNSALPTINVDFITVGDGGNIEDRITGLGAVAEPFNIGKFDITAKQYCAFLNAVASQEDTYHLYNEQMTKDPNIASIQCSVSSGLTHYSVIPGREQFPIVYVSWFSAARFCNWLHNNQPKGNQGPDTTETGAYELNGAMKDIETSTESKNFCEVSPGAKYFIPTEDQWFKAAYYKSKGVNNGYWDYPTKTNIAPGNTIYSYVFYYDKTNQANYYIPTNIYKSSNAKAPFLTPVGAFKDSPGTYGTFDMGGNVFQWTSCKPGSTGSRTIRGGSWKLQMSDELNRKYCATYPSDKACNFIGFRIAAPATVTVPQ
ncbi:MAG TPA: SUMF1/EgtB/PvdO family nonheme iron enzyme [Chthoniobacterales bacterium]|nr:SUMF1/EgtB/PvdO family nonheme iron enzyme [Chthoniobacterales bacterium]